MSTALTSTSAPILAPAPPESALEPWPDISELLTEDGEKLESPFHRVIQNILVDSVAYAWRGRDDYYAGANMFVYYSPQQVKNLDYRGPDFFVVKNVPHRPVRGCWAVWLEGFRYPDAIVEINSESTAAEDFGTKFRIYEQIFRTPEYFCYDPVICELKGWRLIEGAYQAIQPNEQGRLYSEQLQMWLGVEVCRCAEIDTPSPLLRLYDVEGRLIPLGHERGDQEKARADTAQERADNEKTRADTAQERADNEKTRADTAQERADNEKTRADNEKTRADNEKTRADAALSELEQLRALLAQIQGQAPIKATNGPVSPPAGPSQNL